MGRHALTDPLGPRHRAPGPAVTSSTYWRIVDTRTDEPCSVVSYLTEERATEQVEYYRRRDAAGGRPDIHDLIPHLGVRESRSTDTW